MNRQEMLDNIIINAGEWLEKAGAQAPALLINILSQKLFDETREKEFYKKRCEEYDRNN